MSIANRHLKAGAFKNLCSQVWSLDAKEKKNMIFFGAGQSRFSIILFSILFYRPIKNFYILINLAQEWRGVFTQRNKIRY